MEQSASTASATRHNLRTIQNARWKRLVSWAVVACVWMLSVLARNVTYLSVYRWKTRGQVLVWNQCLVSEVASSSTTTTISHSHQGAPSCTHSHQVAPSCTHSHQGALNYTQQLTGVLGRCWETAAACLLIPITGLREYLARHFCIIHSDYRVFARHSCFLIICGVDYLWHGLKFKTNLTHVSKLIIIIIIIKCFC